MGEMTKAQRGLLLSLADGQGIVYSQDGEVGWLTPSGTRLETFAISDSELQRLRDARLMAAAPDPDDEFGYRFSPPEIITPAGRAALTDTHNARTAEDRSDG